MRGNFWLCCSLACKLTHSLDDWLTDWMTDYQTDWCMHIVHVRVSLTSASKQKTLSSDMHSPSRDLFSIHCTIFMKWKPNKMAKWENSFPFIFYCSIFLFCFCFCCMQFRNICVIENFKCVYVICMHIQQVEQQQAENCNEFLAKIEMMLILVCYGQKQKIKMNRKRLQGAKSCHKYRKLGLIEINKWFLKMYHHVFWDSYFILYDKVI